MKSTCIDVDASKDTWDYESCKGHVDQNGTSTLQKKKTVRTTKLPFFSWMAQKYKAGHTDLLRRPKIRKCMAALLLVSVISLTFICVISNLNSPLFYDYSSVSEESRQPNPNTTEAQIAHTITTLESLNSNNIRPVSNDFVALGKLAREFQRAFDIYYQLTVYDYNTLAQRNIEKELLLFEERMYPWVIRGPMHKSSLESLLKSKGRGIVMTTGSKYALVAKHAITTMQFAGCNLPIEIMYCGDEDLGESEAAMLRSLPFVRLIDLRSVLGIGTCRKGWENKPFSVLASSFREVILMDTDALFFQSPDTLFDTKGYNETGTILYRDRTLAFGTYGRGPALKTLMGELAKPFINDLLYKENRVMNGKSSEEIDSGVVVWDKLRAMPAILLTCLLNESPFGDVVYQGTYGDKESYWLAHETLRIPFSIGQGNGGAIGVLAKDGDGGDKVCGGLYHPDDFGNPLWFNGGIGSRVPAKSLEILEPKYWATESSASNIDWDVAKFPFCMRGKMGAPNNHTGTRIGMLTPSERVASDKMVELWIKLFQL
ncbi:hypothetical protein BASA61_010154 [Batrachochytrium salamandrivorans]|nr:hypothetical protein BASA61_010154 [Batrachochytrium salamandrivorans]